MNRYLKEQISALTSCRWCWCLRITSLSRLSRVVHCISTTHPPTHASILELNVYFKFSCQLLLSNLCNVGLWLLCIKIKMLLTVVGLLVKFHRALKNENLCMLSMTEKIWSHEENSGLKVVLISVCAFKADLSHCRIFSTFY